MGVQGRVVYCCPPTCLMVKVQVERPAAGEDVESGATAQRYIVVVPGIHGEAAGTRGKGKQCGIVASAAVWQRRIVVVRRIHGEAAKGGGMGLWSRQGRRGHVVVPGIRSEAPVSPPPCLYESLKHEPLKHEAEECSVIQLTAAPAHPGTWTWRGRGGPGAATARPRVPRAAGCSAR